MAVYVLNLSSILLLFIYSANIPYFNQFGATIDRHAFYWSGELKYMFSLIFGDKSYWGFFIFFFFVTGVSIYAINKFYRKSLIINNDRGQAFYIRVAITVFSISIIALGIRGRISLKTPLHEGLASISTNNLINGLAINPNYYFWKSCFNRTEYQTPVNLDELFFEVKTELGIKTTSRSIKRNISFNEPARKFNVVVILMESMCLFKMGYYHGLKTYPLFDKITRQSTYFDHFFSSGIHTFNGLFSSISGFPSYMDEQPLQEYCKQSFNSVSQILSNNGFSTNFYTTHDKHFDNMSGFLTLNSFQNITGDDGFSHDASINNLGVPDHLMFDKFLSDAEHFKSPFFSVLLTSSDHGPWDIPQDIDYKSVMERKEDNAAGYADWAVYRFFEQAKTRSFYNNTIFIFLGDHGLSMGHTYQMPISYHHIPLVIHCPEIVQADTLHNLGFQPDLGETILGLLRINHTNDGFGDDLFNSNKRFVYFTADDKYGLVSNDGYYFFALPNKQKFLYKYESLDSTNYFKSNKLKADTFEHQAKSFLDLAHYLLKSNYCTY